MRSPPIEHGGRGFASWGWLRLLLAVYSSGFRSSNSFVVVCLVVALELDAEGRAQLGGCCRGRDVLALWRDADGSLPYAYLLKLLITYSCHQPVFLSPSPARADRQVPLPPAKAAGAPGYAALRPRS